MELHKHMLAALAITALGLAGCGGSVDKEHDHEKSKSGKHVDDQGEKGHGHEHVGEPHNLGEVMIGSHKMTVTQRGDAPAGGEAVLECVIALPGGADLTGVVAWLGNQDGEELSARVNAEKHEDGDFDAHIRLPTTIPPGSLYWVEATFKDGSKHKASWPRKE